MLPFVLRANDVEPDKDVPAVLDRITVSLVLSVKLTMSPPAKRLKPEPALFNRSAVAAEASPAMLPAVALSERTGLMIAVFPGDVA